jgi:hypothetical protein
MFPKWIDPFRIDIIQKEDQKWDAIMAPGVYIIMRPKFVQRVSDVDRNGILYIGQAYNLADRLDKFQYAGHKPTYFMLRNLKIASGILQDQVRNENHLYRALGKLKAKICYPIRKSALDEAERAVLFAYLEKFGELPPLNANLPGSQKGKPRREDLRWARKGIKG